MVRLLALRPDLDHHPCRERHQSSKSAADRECLSQKRAEYNFIPAIAGGV
jgi:hypothetical protein